MKTYQIIVDGYNVGTVELTPEEVKALMSDQGIRIKEV